MVVAILMATIHAGILEAQERKTPLQRRAFTTGSSNPFGVAYGPFRDGQRPGGPSPSDKEILEDLKIIQRHWPFLRMYGSRGSAEKVLALIAKEKLNLRVMVGAWIDPEWVVPAEGKAAQLNEENIKANRDEVATAIALAKRYPEHVMAINVGSETQIYWSSHKVRPDILIKYIREVRGKTTVPVTTADDFGFWETEASIPVAAEVDFIVTHMYAMWNKQSLEDAVGWTNGKFRAVASRHHGIPVVIGETGWATDKATTGEQGKLILAPAGEAEQERFYREFQAWVKSNQLPTFYFEAFDENWKGGDDPREVEKHWGVFRADRTPKKILQ
jgi:exo-beta-1,3-glucanase (GH17 family)